MEFEELVADFIANYIQDLMQDPVGATMDRVNALKYAIGIFIVCAFVRTLFSLDFAVKLGFCLLVGGACSMTIQKDPDSESLISLFGFIVTIVGVLAIKTPELPEEKILREERKKDSYKKDTSKKVPTRRHISKKASFHEDQIKKGSEEISKREDQFKKSISQKSESTYLPSKVDSNGPKLLGP